MEADWEFEIAADAPVIDAAWAGLVDLRTEPQRAYLLPEAAQLPALAETLVRLHAPDSPIRTTKCDVWEEGSVDPDEFEAPAEAARCAIGCYIDLLARDGRLWDTLDSVADWSRSVCAALRACALRQCRADLVIRRASLGADQSASGITAYLAGCGSSRAAATAALGACLLVFADVVGAAGASRGVGAKLQ